MSVFLISFGFGLLVHAIDARERWHERREVQAGLRLFGNSRRYRIAVAVVAATLIVTGGLMVG